jgi:NADPH:quinone reductase-like Zn-dependent oxidoreductase
MKSYWIRTEGSAMQLEMREVEPPQPGPGQMRVRLQAAALNRGELIAGHGLHAPNQPARAAGFEAAGVVEAVGPNVSRFRVGDAVMGRCDGAFAEMGLMHEAEVHPKPDTLDWAQAASSTITYSTAHDTLMVQGHLQAGEWVLVTGITSGVGVACLQLAKALGAHVIGSSGSADKLARLQALGLDVPLHTRVQGIAKATLDATGQRGADVAVLSVGGSVLDECIQALGFQGRLGVVGYVDGEVRPSLDLLSLHKKRLHIFGVSNKMRQMSHRIEAAQRFAQDVLPLMNQGAVVPLVDRVYAFDQLTQAQHDMQTNQQVGKLVLSIRD